MRLLRLAVQGPWSMEGIRDRQRVSGNHCHEVVHEIHILAMRQFLRQRHFPLLKRDAIGPFIAFRCLKKTVRFPLCPCRKILTRGKQTVFPTFTDVAHLLCTTTALP